MSRPLSVLLLALVGAASLGATEPFGLGIPTPDPAPTPSGTPAAAPVETAAVPRGFGGLDLFLETVDAIEQAAMRELRAVNQVRVAEGLPPLPYDVRVSVVGSSVTGFSENPNKQRRAFGAHSDIDFMLESDSLVEAARRRGMDPSKGHVHPKRLGQFLPELQAVATQHGARLPNPVTIGISDARSARTAGWSSQNIVLDTGAPRRVDGAPEPLADAGREVLSRAEARELETRVMEEADRLRREASASRQLAEGGSATEAARLTREARSMELAAQHLERSLAEPLRRALHAAEPIPAAEVRARLTRYEGAKIDGVRVPIHLERARDSLVRLPESTRGRPGRSGAPGPGVGTAGTAGTTGRAEALVYLREQAARNFSTPEGRAAYEAYRAIERLPANTPLPELLRRPELLRLSPAVRAELGRVAPRSRGRPGQGRGPASRTRLRAHR